MGAAPRGGTGVLRGDRAPGRAVPRSVRAPSAQGFPVPTRKPASMAYSPDPAAGRTPRRVTAGVVCAIRGRWAWLKPHVLALAAWLPGVPLPADDPRATRARAERIWIDVAALALIVGLALWVDLPAVLHAGIDVLDEGFEYQLASRILQGQVPYRDFFTVVTPLAFYWQALLIRVFGPSLVVGRIATAVTGAGIAGAIYLAGKHVAARPLALAAALLSIPWGIPYWPQPNYSWYVTLLALLTAWTALRAGARRGGWVVVGVLAAAAVLTKQNVGLATAASVLLYAAWRGGGRALVRCTLALGAPIAAFVVYLGLAGALPAFWYQTVAFAIQHFPRAAGIPYPALRSALHAARTPGRGGLQALVSYLPQAVLAAGLPLLAVGALRPAWRRAWLPEGVFAWLLVLAGLTIAYPRSDFVHIDYALPTAFLGLAWLLSRGVGARPALLPLAVLPMLALLGPVWPHHPIAANHGGGSGGLPALRGLRLNPGTLNSLRVVTRAIDHYAAPGMPVLVLPYAAMLYYLADRPNPTPYDLDITLNMPPGGNAKIAQVMALTHCPVFYQPRAGISAPFHTYGAPVIAELRRDYSLVGQAGAFQIWLWSGPAAG